MTAQVPERLMYAGETHRLAKASLEDYFRLSGTRSPFQWPHTALWRGYVGTWEILDNRLYLLALEGHLDNGAQGSLATIFPGYPDRVFAHWFTGHLRVPQGKLLEYQHAGFASRYEQELIFEVDRGVISDSWVKVNGRYGNAGTADERRPGDPSEPEDGQGKR